ncbi:DUF4255 domain-containing protein [Pseudaestuariivita atlantica]|uniref:Pvc16 N-terminal domain-containing protein n=1 Tax=Pseudaestuariivita atlantica TaxID=1317121 RepID=A0A0L1JMS9_9RHOB|nr:DUF4255 domain-containing protein [Pseudaestuariivita atlantica]KNG93060.1 hypothetical protein ATO11_14165 [Pseudaestuariivita atlantica]
MIEATLSFLATRLTRHLQARFPGASPVALGAPPQADATAAEALTNRVVLTLINVERHAAMPARAAQDGSVRTRPPLHLDLVFLATANFADDYRGALRMLSATMGFAQANPVFTRQSAPDLPEGLDRLALDWRDLDLQALHNIWNVLGGGYRPSAVFAAQIVTVDDALAGIDGIPIRGVDVEL